jgi:hypothetical protein
MKKKSAFRERYIIIGGWGTDLFPRSSIPGEMASWVNRERLSLRMIEPHQRDWEE